MEKNLSVEIPELHIGPWQELRLAQFIAARSSSESVKEYYEQWKQLADSIGESEATKRLVWSPLFDSAKSDPLFGLRRAITRGSPQTEKKEIDIKRPFTSHGAFSSLPSKTLVPETRKANDKDKIKSKTKPKKTTELEGVKRVQKMKKVYMKHLGYENSQEKSPSKKQTQSVQAHNSPFSPFAQSPPSSDILNFTSRNITNSPPSPIHMWDLDHSQSDHLPHLPRQRRIVTPGSLTKTYTASDVALSPLGRDQCKRQSETKSIQKSTLLNDRMHTLIYQDEQTPNQYQSAAFRYKIPSYNTENSISSTLPPPSDSFQQCSNTKPHVSQFSFAPAFDSTPLPLPSPLSLSTQQSQTPHKSTEPRSHKTNNEFRYDQQKSVSQTRLNISHRARSPLQTLNEQAFAHSLKSPNHNKGQRSTNFRQASPKSIHKPHSPNFLMDSIESEDFDREVQKLLDWTKGLDLDKSL